MSATYRITVDHEPANVGTFGEWSVTVRRLSDDGLVASRYADSASEADAMGREIARQDAQALNGYTLLVNDAGETVQHSVKA